jgi:hypothetical protein
MTSKNQGPTERETLISYGLLPNPNEQAWPMTATADHNPDPGVLAAELETVTHRLAERVEQLQQSYDREVRNGYELRDDIRRLARALDYLASRHKLTSAQVEMLNHLGVTQPEQP